MERPDDLPRPDDAGEAPTYFIRQGANVQGPFPMARLRAWSRKLKLKPEMEVSPDGETWIKAREVPGLFERRSRRKRVRTRGWTFLHTMKRYTPHTHATTALIGLNALMFVVVVVATGAFQPSAGEFLDWGANYGPRTTQGEWWRLFTCTFLHADLLHLAFNMIILFYIGRLMERLLGRGGFLVLYVVAGLTGSLGSLVGHDARVSVGASGSIFGLFGGILGFLSRRDRDPIARGVLAPAGRTAAIYMLIELGLGWRSAGVDYGAHVGGFVGGFAMGCLLAHPLTEKGVAGRRRRWIVGAASGLVLVTGVAFAMGEVDEIQGPLSHYHKTERWLRKTHGWALRYEEGRPEDERRAYQEKLETEIMPAWQEVVDGLVALDNPPREFAAHVRGARDRAVQILEVLSQRLQVERSNDPTAIRALQRAERVLAEMERRRWGRHFFR
ncbi:MAG: rhomboid family intramembrane serine protease [Planctomycetota bacterium]|nr:rhomboid family intramembrane serine protease [Planctomycetota bacterium]